MRLSGVSANSTGKTKSSTRTSGPVLGVSSSAVVAVESAVKEPTGVAAGIVGVSASVPVETLMELAVGTAVADAPQATVIAVSARANTTK